MARSAAALLAGYMTVAQAIAAPAMDPEIKSESFVTSDGAHLHVLEACPPGAARSPVIAFVTGWSMPAEIWRAQLSALGARHCVAALDPRGQGESEVPAGGYNIERRAQDLGEFIARYPRVVLVGWSLGALEALECVNRHGHTSVDALVLVDSSVGEEPQPPSAGGFIESLKTDRRAAMEEFVRDTFRSPREDEEIAALTQAALRMPLEASLSLFPRERPRQHWRDIARSFPKPLLYVVTKEFAEQARNLAKNRPGTRIEVFEEAGHALFADEPARFNELIERFVGESGVGT